MAGKKRKYRAAIIILVFILYFFSAARPIEREIVLVPKWISALTQSTVVDSVTEELLPFTLGEHFGYIDSFGQLALNKIRTNNIYLDKNMWTEFDAQPANIEIKNIFEETIINIENTKGYPVLLDDRIFILGSEQNSLSEIGEDGSILWTYEFGAPLTCIDAKAGLLLTGSLDGVIEIFNSSGQRIFFFEPGGSRYAVILGCAVSSDGSRIGIISGIDQQRFLLLERFGNGNDYRVVYHEFIDTGFRRPVRILFIDEDRYIVFERMGGISIYNVRSRRSVFIPLDGVILAVEDSCNQSFFFLVTAPDYSDNSLDKNLIGIKFPRERWLPPRSAIANEIFLNAPFKSNDVFLGRNGSMLVVGGGSALISFELEEK